MAGKVRQDEQAGIDFVGVLGVKHIGLRAAIYSVRVALLAQFGLERGPLHLHPQGVLSIAPRVLGAPILNMVGLASTICALTWHEDLQRFGRRVRLRRAAGDFLLGR